MKSEKTAVKNINIRIKGVPLLVLVLCLLSLLAAFLPSHSKAQGRALGKVVGAASGSYKGVTEGIAAGAAAGKSDGLSATDTAAVVKEELTDAGRLEVLVAGVKLTNNHAVGSDYAALYILKGNAVFTVDLKKAVVSYGESRQMLVIEVPEPEVDIYIDERETKKLAEYQKHYFAGNAEDGFAAYLNTMKNTVAEVKESLTDYDSLMEQAREAARGQIKFLAESVGGNASVEIHFLPEEEQNVRK